MAMAMATMMATSNSSIRGPWRCPKPAASQRPGPFPRPSLAARCGPFALNGSALTRCRTSMAPIGLPIALRVNEVPAKWGPTIWSSCFPWKNCHRYIQKRHLFPGLWMTLSQNSSGSPYFGQKPWPVQRTKNRNASGKAIFFTGYLWVLIHCHPILWRF